VTNPTNTDLAAALREIADTLPLGSALIVRLAADRLGVDTDGWIEWKAFDGAKCPVPDGTRTEVKFDDGKQETDETPEWWTWRPCARNIVAYRVVK